MSDEEASENGTQDPLLRAVIRLLRAYDKEASESGGTRISGRTARAAGLAFNPIFGSEIEKIKDKREKAKEESKKESKEDTDDKMEQKKTAAQRVEESLARSKIYSCRYTITCEE